MGENIALSPIVRDVSLAVHLAAVSAGVCDEMPEMPVRERCHGKFL